MTARHNRVWRSASRRSAVWLPWSRSGLLVGVPWLHPDRRSRSCRTGWSVDRPAMAAGGPHCRQPTTGHVLVFDVVRKTLSAGRRDINPGACARLRHNPPPATLRASVRHSAELFNCGPGRPRTGRLHGSSRAAFGRVGPEACHSFTYTDFSSVFSAYHCKPRSRPIPDCL